ncbi:hypothetical protein [Marinitenerispora sediminis]|uniref:Uncharacterized protein n=1 Tax=Marinitenerispora sediminis TaxID=1931232 RepID=A0A368T5J0_9ACTN|nr:hypothetical protein [Marinitenerispora sediminis]RCV50128.1 hypothetical protein DEF28_18955 [Marinitenerispora sediminis]RCV54545.1 hypothetical protein DEF23_15765 [Marinitenerispora sediminis]RCV58788.1 hypothetical protein DEF24_12195 [Marinitenerispora sediminis]
MTRLRNCLILMTTAALLSLATPAVADDEMAALRRVTVKVKCTKIRLSDNSGVGHVFGTGTAKTYALAEKAAVKNANDQMPRGYRAKHCHPVR